MINIDNKTKEKMKVIGEKRIPIENKFRNVILRVTIFSMLAIGIASLLFMLWLRNHSEKRIVENLEKNTVDQVTDLATFTAYELYEYSVKVAESANYIEDLYVSSDKYEKQTVVGHKHIPGDNYCFHRYFANESYKNIDFGGELELLANSELFWKPILEADDGNITSIYFGTESGFFISLDKYHIEDVVNESNEEYFDYFSRPWYIKAKEENDIIFTDVDEDYFGRGLMLTCATPFYKDGKIAGVIGLDLLVDDIQNNIIGISAGEGSYAFAVDKTGRIIASPKIDKASVKMESIRDKNKDTSLIADKILSGETGMERVGDYYYVYSPIQNINWMVCVKLPQSIVKDSIKVFDRNIYRMLVIFTAISLLILCIVYAITESFAAQFTKPILKLKDDVEIISKGNLDYKAESTSNDEIGDLAMSFNDMTLSLKNYINNITNLTAEKERNEAELNIATTIQAGMLPSTFPAYPDDKRFDIYATMVPAKEVGGDFYDFFKIDDKRLAIVVADVSGKGVPAALFMAIGKSLIKDHSYFHDDLSEVFRIVNNVLCDNNKEDLFITAFEGVIDLDTGKMIYVNAGHELPFIYKKGVGFKPVQMKPAFVLGGMKNIKFTTGEINLEKEDIIFEYTDGVTEATNTKNELYGMDRLTNILNDCGDISPFDLLPRVKKDIDEFVGDAPQFDDITMLGFKFGD